MLIGHGRVADVLMGRPQLAGGAVQEEAECTIGVVLHQLAHGANVVRRDQLVVPRKCCRMAAVVYDRRDDTAVAVARYPADDQRVIGGLEWVVAADDAIACRTPGRSGRDFGPSRSFL